MIKRYSKKDPHLEREKEKYENPVPSREFIIQYLDELGKPVTRKHLIQVFDLKSEDEKEALRRRLRAMERDGQLLSNRRGQYALVEKMELIRGRVIGKREGYGFLVPDDGSDDLYLSPYQMRLIFPDDIVLARICGVDHRGRREGNIVEILERNTLQVVGYFRQEGGVYFVEPEKKDIQQIVLIPQEDINGAVSGQIVVAQIMAYPTLKRQATGRVSEILGNHMAPGLEIEVSIRTYELPYQWSDSVLKETNKIAQEVSENEVAQRRDLRKLAFVTIDGEDAKDFDDAVYAQRNDSGWKLYVAIADVSHYIQPDSELDKEAIKRGNSVYFPNRVIPMLPEELSNGICSLKPNVDRLCLVCEMDVDKDGSLVGFQFYDGVIRSQARLTYTVVFDMLKQKKGDHLYPHIETLYQLYKKLYQQKLLRGALEFEKVETRIIFGENRKIKKIVPVTRNEAHRIIEECMLLANVAAAHFLKQNNLPLLYRVHKGPDTEKLENLRAFLNSLGLRLTGKDHPTPLDYAKLLQRVEGRIDAHIIQTILLRSLKQAIYSPINEGHFGLAYDFYCHFTSPIRRFPDVIVHRGIRHIIKKQAPEYYKYDMPLLVGYADHCSMTERRADQATRDVVDWLKCEYMLDKLGAEFEGIISDVTGFGIFVELKDIYVEGLVHVTALKNDYYHFDPISRSLIGKRSGTSYSLGDQVQVKIVRVNLDQKQLDFDLVTTLKAKSKTKAKTKTKTKTKDESKKTKKPPKRKV